MNLRVSISKWNRVLSYLLKYRFGSTIEIIELKGNPLLINSDK